MVGGLFVSVHGPLDSEEDFMIKANFIGAVTIAHENEKLMAAQVADTPELIPWSERPGHTSPVQVPPLTHDVYGTKSGILLDRNAVREGRQRETDLMFDHSVFEVKHHTECKAGGAHPNCSTKSLAVSKWLA